MRHYQCLLSKLELETETCGVKGKIDMTKLQYREDRVFFFFVVCLFFCVFFFFYFK